MTNTEHNKTNTTLDSEAWEALKLLGDSALDSGGIQAVLHMFVAVLTSAEKVAQENEEAGNPPETTAEVISAWLASTYVPMMLQAVPAAPAGQ